VARKDLGCGEQRTVEQRWKGEKKKIRADGIADKNAEKGSAGNVISSEKELARKKFSWDD